MLALDWLHYSNIGKANDTDSRIYDIAIWSMMNCSGMVGHTGPPKLSFATLFSLVLCKP